MNQNSNFQFAMLKRYSMASEDATIKNTPREEGSRGAIC